MTVPSGLDRAGRAAVRRILEHPKFEVLPLKNVLDQVRWLPDGATVSITASPTKTLEDTMDVAAELRLRGFQVVPHLSARMTHDKRHLAALLGRMEQLEMSRIFLVGGDAPQRGIFPDAYSLLLAMDDLGHHLTEIGSDLLPRGTCGDPGRQAAAGPSRQAAFRVLPDHPDVFSTPKPSVTSSPAAGRTASPSPSG